jgi:hypothetical protein
LQQAYARDGSYRDPVVAINSERVRSARGISYQKPVFSIVGWMMDDPATAVALPKQSTAEIVNDTIDEFSAPSKPVPKAKLSAEEKRELDKVEQRLKSKPQEDDFPF